LPPFIVVSRKNSDIASATPLHARKHREFLSAESLVT
jgi:hypothetical protein